MKPFFLLHFSRFAEHFVKQNTYFPGFEVPFIIILVTQHQKSELITTIPSDFYFCVLTKWINLSSVFI